MPTHVWLCGPPPATAARTCMRIVIVITVLLSPCSPTPSTVHAATDAERGDVIMGTGGGAWSGRDPETGDRVMQVTPQPAPAQQQEQMPLIIVPEVRIDGKDYLPPGAAHPPRPAKTPRPGGQGPTLPRN